jgi:NADH dehydrogenase
MAGRVFVTGASGFVGSSVLKELLGKGFAVNALVNRGKLPVQDPNVRQVPGDLFNSAALNEGMAGCEAAIHLVGIIMEKPSKGITFERIHVKGTKAVVDAAKRNGIRRYIHMSALGTRPNAASTYHRTKWQAEEYVRSSGLDWTILRPSLIHGPGGFMTMEAKWARKTAPPFVGMPYFGKGIFGLGGSGLLQPVYVNDVARAFVEALASPQTIRRTYDLAGPERFTWPEFHEASAQIIVGKRRRTAPLPAWFARLLATAGLGPLLDFSRDQVIMSHEDNIADTTPFENDFGWKPQALRETLRQYGANL